MAGTITHYWNGTQLVVTSDSGTSSADLAGATGPRGPQGRPGVIYDADGNLYLDDIPSSSEVERLDARVDALENKTTITPEYVDTKINAKLDDYYNKSEVDAKLKTGGVDMTGYATEEYVNNAIANIEVGGGADVDLSAYATKSYVNNAVANADVDLTDYPTFNDMSVAIAQAQLGGSGDGSGVDLSGFATKSDIDNLADGETIISENGKLSTAFGGRVIGQEGNESIGNPVLGMKSSSSGVNGDYTGGDLFQFNYTGLNMPSNRKYTLTITINGTPYVVKNVKYGPANITAAVNPYFYGVSVFRMATATIVYLYVNDPSLDWTGDLVESIEFRSGTVNTYEPIDGNALPVDNQTIGIIDGKLGLIADFATIEYVDAAIANAGVSGGGDNSGESVNVDLSNYYTKSEVDAKIADAGATDLSNYYTKAQTEAYVMEQRLAIEAWVNQKFATLASSEGVEY